MLPPDHWHRYEAFRQALTQTCSLTQTSEPGAALKPMVAELQQRFQEQILSLDMADLPSAIAHSVQAYQVEINKQLRLLSMDAMFLQAARQPATVTQRQQQASDRLQTLIRYCDALLQPQE